MSASVAAQGTWTDPEGARRPAGHVHAWIPGKRQTMCGLFLDEVGLEEFPGLSWEEAQPGAGRDPGRVTGICPRCLAATGRNRDQRPWAAGPRR